MGYDSEEPIRITTRGPKGVQTQEVQVHMPPAPHFDIPKSEPARFSLVKVREASTLAMAVCRVLEGHELAIVTAALNLAEQHVEAQSHSFVAMVPAHRQLKRRRSKK